MDQKCAQERMKHMIYLLRFCKNLKQGALSWVTYRSRLAARATLEDPLSQFISIFLGCFAPGITSSLSGSLWHCFWLGPGVIGSPKPGLIIDPSAQQLPAKPGLRVCQANNTVSDSTGLYSSTRTPVHSTPLPRFPPLYCILYMRITTAEAATAAPRVKS